MDPRKRSAATRLVGREAHLEHVESTAAVLSSVRGHALQRLAGHLAIDPSLARATARSPDKGLSKVAYLSASEKAALASDPEFTRRLAETAMKYAHLAKNQYLPRVGPEIVPGVNAPVGFGGYGGYGVGGGSLPAGFGFGHHRNAGDPRPGSGGVPGADPFGTGTGGLPGNFGLGSHGDADDPLRGYGRGGGPAGFSPGGMEEGPGDIRGAKKRFGLGTSRFGSGAQLPSSAWRALHPGAAVSEDPDSGNAEGGNEAVPVQPIFEDAGPKKGNATEGGDKKASPEGKGEGITPPPKTHFTPPYKSLIPEHSWTLEATAFGALGALTGAIVYENLPGLIIGGAVGGAAGVLIHWLHGSMPNPEGDGSGGPASANYMPADSGASPVTPKSNVFLPADTPGSPVGPRLRTAGAWRARDFMPPPDAAGGGGPRSFGYYPNPESDSSGTPRS